MGQSGYLKPVFVSALGYTPTDKGNPKRCIPLYPVFAHAKSMRAFLPLLSQTVWVIQSALLGEGVGTLTIWKKMANFKPPKYQM